MSVSRRTDVPAFHSEWFMNRVRAGSALVRNPVCRDLLHRVELSTESVDCFVFFTKDPRPMMRHLDELDGMGHEYVFQITVNPYGADIEPGVPRKAEVAESFRELGDRIGRGRLVWRYDPVILGGRMTVEYHRRKFETLCNELGDRTDRCTVGFLRRYGKLEDRLAAAGLRTPDARERGELAGWMAESAGSRGIELTRCCPGEGPPTPGLESRACVDGATMRALGIPHDPEVRPLRDGCECIRNVDIGAYDTCGHGCIYCYANSHRPGARAGNVYDPGSEILFGGVGPGDTVTELPSRRNRRIDGF